MENFKGTKGEWRFSKEHECITTSKVGIVEGSKIICQINTSVSFDYSSEEFKANAKLIAAAPELLKALKSCVMSMQAHPDNETNSEFEGFINNGWDAIEKALGQTAAELVIEAKEYINNNH